MPTPKFSGGRKPPRPPVRTTTGLGDEADESPDPVQQPERVVRRPAQSPTEPIYDEKEPPPIRRIRRPKPTKKSPRLKIFLIAVAVLVAIMALIFSAF